MALDVGAHIIVGLPLKTFDAEKMPGYKDLCDDDGPPTALELIEYYGWGDGAEFLEHYDGEIIDVVRTYVDCGDDRIIVGFPIAETSSWEPLKIGLGTLAEKHINAAAAFYGLFKKNPKIYLVPRMW